MKRLLTLAAAMALTVALVGCSDDDNDNPVTPQSTPQASVQVTHASPDAPAVDLIVDGAEVGSDLAFPNSTGYLKVDAGTRNVKVNVANTSTTAIEGSVPVQANKNYSIFAVNTVANIEPLILEDDLTPPASGNAHVRFIHLSPDAPAVDITLTDGTIVFGDYAFKDASAFTPLPAGTYDLQVRVQGTTTVVLDLPGITVQDGKIYTVFARGLVAGAGDQALGAQIIVNK
jgi:major membrane immunogen (membrane-anchored lipoprotein)